MNALKIYILILCGSLCFGSCSSDESSTDENPVVLEAETFENVSYGTNPEQVYDLYLPAGRSSQKTKVVVLVHGGGWTEGDKTNMNGYVSLLQETHPDHAIVNVNYVLAALPATPAFPNQFLDLQTIIEKLSEEKENLQILDEFGLIGVSAGAHISLMYDYVYDTEDQVKFVCDIVGPTNFKDPFYANDPNYQILLSLLVDEDAYPENSDVAALISPALQVTADSSPTLLFYGDQDPLVPLSNGSLLKENLSISGVTHRFTVYEGGHGNWDLPSLVDLQFQLEQYIDTHLAINE